jgi:hypothetical protein
MTVIDDALRIIDARNGASHQKLLQVIAEADLSVDQRRALIERLKAAGLL